MPSKKFAVSPAGRLHRASFLLALLLAWPGLSPAAAPSLTVLRPASTANKSVPGENQTHAEVATNLEGMSLVAWQSDTLNGSRTVASVFYRFFDAAGKSLPQAEIKIPAASVLAGTPCVASDGGSYFAIAWCERSTSGKFLVCARLLSPSGNVLVARRQINVIDSDQDCFPSIDMDSRGFLGVVWSSYTGSKQDVLIRLLDKTGAPLIAPTPVNETSLSILTQALPDIDIANSGIAVVGWSQVLSERRSAASFRTLNISTPTRIVWGAVVPLQKPGTTELQKRPMVAVSDAGDIAIGYVSETAANAPASIRLALYAPSGTRRKAPFAPNSSRAGDTDRIVPVMFSDGTFFCAWDAVLQGETDRNIYGRPFDKNGTALAPDSLLNAEVKARNQKRAALSTIGNTNTSLLTLTFEGENVTHNDDVFFKQFGYMPN